jgi:O-methyltransferase
MLINQKKISLQHLKSTSAHKIIYKVPLVASFLAYVLAATQFKRLKFYKSRDTVELIQSIRKEVGLLFSPDEAYVIFSISRAQSILEGDMAEVGVYRGASAKLICEGKGNRKLHLFDTFEGLHNVSDADTHFGDIRFWRERQFSGANLESVRKYLSQYDNVFFYKGEFPSTADPIMNSRFSFVHLDADLYRSILDSLNFFYPRLVEGGIILSHDYHADGVKRAFDEFLKDRQKSVIELASTQCILIR